MKKLAVNLALVLVVVCCGAGAVLAETSPLILDHDMLQSMARTGPAKDVRLEYTDDRVLFKTRYRAAVVWLDVRLEAQFVRAGARVHLEAKRLTVGGLNQNGARFMEASEKLAHLVDVETAAQRVEIYRAGKLAYAQEVLP